MVTSSLSVAAGSLPRTTNQHTIPLLQTNVSSLRHDSGGTGARHGFRRAARGVLGVERRRPVCCSGWRGQWRRVRDSILHPNCGGWCDAKTQKTPKEALCRKAKGAEGEWLRARRVISAQRSAGDSIFLAPCRVWRQQYQIGRVADVRCVVVDGGVNEDVSETRSFIQTVVGGAMRKRRRHQKRRCADIAKANGAEGEWPRARRVISAQRSAGDSFFLAPCRVWRQQYRIGRVEDVRHVVVDGGVNGDVSETRSFIRFQTAVLVRYENAEDTTKSRGCPQRQGLKKKLLCARVNRTSRDTSLRMWRAFLQVVFLEPLGFLVFVAA